MVPSSWSGSVSAEMNAISARRLKSIEGFKNLPFSQHVFPSVLIFPWSRVFLEFDVFDVEPHEIKGLLVKVRFMFIFDIIHSCHTSRGKH